MKPAAQSYICDLNPYNPGLPVEAVARMHGLDPTKIIKLASNENPLGMSPKVKAALRRALNSAHLYPDQHELASKLAAKLGVKPDNIVLGNGSNDVLDLAARVFLGRGSESVTSRYAFPVYQIAAQTVGATNIIVPDSNFGHDLKTMSKAISPRAKVVWLANPNNPTGTFVPYQEVESFLEGVPKDVVVVLDEAYREYLPPEDQADTAGWVARHPNLVVTRTFSKAYGLAGLRIGYAVAVPEVAELMNRARHPFNVNSLAVAAASAALDDDDFVRRSADLNRTVRVELQAGLRRLGLETLPAHGNFVTVNVGDASSIYQGLLKNGIIVRPLAASGMPQWLRVTAGTLRQNNLFLKTLNKLLV